LATPTYTTPTTWADGNVVTAAQLNAQLRDNVARLSTPVACQAVRSSNLAITTATVTSVTLTATDNWDTDSIHSTSSNPSRFTIPTGQDGTYRVDACVVFEPSASGTIRYMRLIKNGAVIAADPAYLLDASSLISGVWSCILNGTREVAVVAGDYLEVQVYHDKGSNLNVTNAMISIRKVSE
jgi:hypothetical protein